MFNKKSKKPDKNDEIFVDYSKEVDVKKKEEDEAKPEHYDALEIKDEIVVSSSQITQAKNQVKQEKRINQALSEEPNQTRKAEKSNQNQKVEDNPNQEDEMSSDFVDEDASERRMKDTIDLNDEEVTLRKVPTMKNQTTEDEVEEQTLKVTPDIANQELKGVEDTQDDELESFDTLSPSVPSFLRSEMRQTKSTEEQTEPLDSENESLEDAHLEEVDELEEEWDTQDALKGNHRDIEEKQVRKQDLHSYFQIDTSVLKKGLRRKKLDAKKTNEEDRHPKYQIKHHRFYTMEEFVAYLDAHYEHVDEIAGAILNDEQFFRWLKEESVYFEESILKMKRFKQDLKQ